MKCVNLYYITFSLCCPITLLAYLPIYTYLAAESVSLVALHTFFSAHMVLGVSSFVTGLGLLVLGWVMSGIFFFHYNTMNAQLDESGGGTGDNNQEDDVPEEEDTIFTLLQRAHTPEQWKSGLIQRWGRFSLLHGYVSQEAICDSITRKKNNGINIYQCASGSGFLYLSVLLALTKSYVRESNLRARLFTQITDILFFAFFALEKWEETDTQRVLRQWHDMCCNIRDLFYHIPKVSVLDTTYQGRTIVQIMQEATHLDHIDQYIHILQSVFLLTTPIERESTLSRESTPESGLLFDISDDEMTDNDDVDVNGVFRVHYFN